MRAMSFLLVCSLFLGCNYKGNADIYSNFIEEKDNSTILKLNFLNREEVSFSDVLNTDSNVEVYFGDGDFYKGSGRNIPTKLYERGSYIAIINSDKLSLIWNDSAYFLKQIKFNGVSKYNEIYFNKSGLETIGIDEDNPPLFKQSYFSLCFSNCTLLKEVPSNLFKNSAEAVNFHACFFNCTSLKSIPENLFKYNTKAINFLNCFSNCTSLESIPENLFNSNINVTSFHACFYGCSSLKVVPKNLFSNNHNVTSFGFCFAGCSELCSIPENLFANNDLAKSFYACFANCSSLKEIPENMFNDSVSVGILNNCFTDI